MKGILSSTCVLVFLSWSSALAQEQPANIQLADQADAIAEVSGRVKATLALEPMRKIEIDGEYFARSMVLAASEIVFKPNGRLIFDTGSVLNPSNFFIVASKITVEDPNNPGIVTWIRNVPGTPPDRGQAGVGEPGRGEGANGGPGGGGASGTTGITGPNAPSITLMVQTIKNGGLVVDFAGGQGGKGGPGQLGGQGGPGAQGHGARQARHSVLGATIWEPWCEAGPGHGGTGGPGGPGGVGGTGGAGGSGGNITLVSWPDAVPTITQVIRVVNNGGAGGDGGDSGVGGSGGPGGPEGQLANFCNSAGRQGSPGAQGAGNTIGLKGDPGRDGQVYTAILTKEQFKALFGF